MYEFQVLQVDTSDYFFVVFVLFVFDTKREMNGVPTKPYARSTNYVPRYMYIN